MNWRMYEPSAPRRRLQPLHLEAAHLRAELGLGREVGIGHLLLRGVSVFHKRPRADEPQPGRDLERIVEPGIDFVDVRAERFELRARPRPRGRDLGIAPARSRAPARRRRAGRDAVVEAAR